MFKVKVKTLERRHLLAFLNNHARTVIYNTENKFATSQLSLTRRFEPPFYRQPPSMVIPLFLYFFPNPPLLARLFRQNRPSEIPDKHKNKLIWQNYFFIFRRLKNVTCFFYKQPK